MRVRPGLQIVTTLLWLAGLACCLVQPAFSAGELEFLMDSDPELQEPEPVQEFSPALKSLWMAALDRPEQDMQRMAAETIARAQERGVPDLAAAVPRLEQILQSDSSHPAARYAAARALIVLDSRDSVDLLFEASQAHGSDLRQLIEPALAAWRYEPAKSIWIERLNTTETRPRELILAIRGLGLSGESTAVPRLMALAGDVTVDAGIRIEAATAAGQIAETGLEEDAARLARQSQTPPSLESICAVRLLARHDSDHARQVLRELAEADEPVVAAAALQRLNEIDPVLVVPLASAAIESPDPRIRLEAVRCYVSVPAADRIRPLGQLLADSHPQVRSEAREGLAGLAENPDLSDLIRTSAMEVLSKDQWAGQEQAALLLGALEHQPAADRLIELLSSSRPEVMVASAWALRKVAVPETVPAIIEWARQQTEVRTRGVQPGLDEQVAHLFEALGVLNDAQAMPLLMEYLPKGHLMGERSRSAAIWAIGRMKEGTRDEDLEKALGERIADFDDKFPELSLVKQMCAVALARMDAVDQASLMRSIATGSSLPTRLEVALRWAVLDLTGEELPMPEPPRATQVGWFLEPVP